MDSGRWIEIWEDDEEEEKQPFEVDDDNKADWCLRKIEEAQMEKAQWKEHYSAQLDKISARLDRNIEYFKGKLLEYFNRVPHKVTKTQESYALMNGKLVMRKQQPMYERDNAVLVKWLEENGMEDLVKVTKTANWAELKKISNVQGGMVLTQHGEIVPGINVIEEPDVFEVKIDNDREGKA